MILKHNYFLYTIFILAIFGIILFSGCTQQASTAPAPQTKDVAAPVAEPSVAPTQAPPPIVAPTTPLEPAPAKSTEEFLTYDNPVEGIKIQYPSGWAKDEQSGLSVVTFISPEKSVLASTGAGLGIGIQDLSDQPTTLDQFTKLNVADIAEIVSNENILESTATTLDGNPAHKIVYNRKSGVDNFKFMQIWTIKNNKAYIISYVAPVEGYSKSVDTINKMVASFEITNAATTPITTNKFLEYTSSEENIRMKYPSDWSKKEKYAGTIVSFISLKEGSNVNVVVQDLSTEPMTLNEYTETSIAQLKYFIPDMKVIESSEAATLDGNRAYKIIYIGTISENVFKWMQVWTIKNNKAYVISYTTTLQNYPNSLDKVNEMINSFKFT